MVTTDEFVCAALTCCWCVYTHGAIAFFSRQVQEELCRYGADIICLQECDNSYHDVLVTLNDKAGAEVTERLASV